MKTEENKQGLALLKCKSAIKEPKVDGETDESVITSPEIEELDNRPFSFPNPVIFHYKERAKFQILSF